MRDILESAFERKDISIDTVNFLESNMKSSRRAITEKVKERLHRLSVKNGYLANIKTLVQLDANDEPEVWLTHIDDAIRDLSFSNKKYSVAKNKKEDDYED